VLTSEDVGLSMGATSHIFLYRARFLVRRRQLNSALADLAAAHTLDPLNHEVSKNSHSVYVHWRFSQHMV